MGDDKSNLQFRPSWPASSIPRGDIPKRTIAFWFITSAAISAAVGFIWCVREHISPNRLFMLSSASILGTLSLVLTLHARNMSISDRIRNLGKDANAAMFDGLPVQRVAYRLKSIGCQVRDLHSRYRLNLYSLVCVAANLLVMPIVVLSIPLEHGNDLPVPYYTIASIMISTSLFTFAASATIADLFLSFVTLEADMACSYEAIEIKSAQIEDIDPDDMAAVVHFNRQYHKIWHVLRVKLELENDLNRRENLREIFFSRYIGLLHEEFHFVSNDLLPRSLFKQWLECIRENALNRKAGRRDGDDREFGGFKMIEWWKLHEGEYRDPRFKRFLDMAFEIARHSEPGRIGQPYELNEIMDFIFDKSCGGT